MKKIIFGLSLLMSIVAFPLRASELNLGTTDSFGSTNKGKNHSQKQNTVTGLRASSPEHQWSARINHKTSGKFDKDSHCTCKNCIEISKRNQHNKEMAGGYTQQRNLTKQEKQFFKNTYNGKGKDKLTPISVATQVVNGTNYKFICKDKHGKKVTVIIYQSLPHMGSKSKVVSINS